jgi:hypothetical protein
MFGVALFGCCTNVVMMGVEWYSFETGYVSMSSGDFDDATMIVVNFLRCKWIKTGGVLCVCDLDSVWNSYIYIEVTGRSPMITSISVNWQEREAVGKSAVDMAQQQCHDRSLGVTCVLLKKLEIG